MLGEPLTAHSHSQVRDENSGHSPVEDEFLDRQVGKSCHSHLVSQPQSEHVATYLEVTKWPTNDVLQRTSKVSPYLVLGRMAIATFPILIQWL